MKKDYFLGLDCGTSSVGWAVTDEDYKILRAKGKSLWGSRLFEESKTAEERRMSRSARRSNYRKVVRLDLLDEFFKSEINKVDPNFFTRLNDSKYWLEDKTNSSDKNTLFNDKKYKDADFHRQYPTVFHLRSELIHNKDVHDIRLVYLAIHHILKHRGHFIYEGQNIESVQNVKPLFMELQNTYNDLEESVTINYLRDFEEIGKVLADKSIRNRSKILKDYLEVSCNDSKKGNKILSEIIKALLGNKVNLQKLFPFAEIEFDEIDSKGFEFSSSMYDVNEEKLKSDIGIDLFGVVDCLKEIYDWSLLDSILHGNSFISDSKIEIYKIHKEELKKLKTIVKEYAPDKYDEAFFETKDKLNNYCAYIGHGLSDDGRKDKGVIKSKCTTEDVNKYFKKILEGAKKAGNTSELFKEIYNKLELNILLPKAIVGDNRVIPYQVNLFELESILNNAKNYLSFLEDKDDEGFSIHEKIIAIMKFRIPYYVGPLVENDGSGKEYQKFSWMIRKENSTGRILPWKFADQVDLAACGNAFIKRMARKCTYLPNENVLPKNSILYSKFSVLNEINNLKINGEKPSIEVKNQIYSLFKKSKSVTHKKVKKMLVSIGYAKKEADIEFTGVDLKFNSNLKSYIDFKDFLEKNILSIDEIDEIIEWATVFSEGQGLLKNKIIEKYGPKLTNDEVKKIIINCKSYSGWGNLSKKFLTEMYDVDKDTGECKNIITKLKETNYNLMELLSSKFTISESVELELDKTSDANLKFTYDSLVEPLLVSPTVKRSIWQTILIVKELTKVMKNPPKRIFIEMARGGEKGKKKQRTESRKDSLIQNYRNITDNSDAVKILNALENEENDSLRKEKLYLYYSQMGRCMYSNEKIILSDLLSTNNIYDIDHIYPQCNVKDNNIDNKVLVKSTENRKKADSYPISLDVQNKCRSHWKLLLKHNLISKEKFNRLDRKTKLTDDELQNFIARQLVETRQSTKATARILEKMYPETDIIFSKAGNVSDFRNSFNLHKARSVNDLHHAKDAYLNIVVGNVYHTKFTKNPGIFFTNKRTTSDVKQGINERYNLSKIFDYDVKRNGKYAWIKDSNGRIRSNKGNDYNLYPENGTILTVRKYMAQDNILFTRQKIQRKGQIADLNIVKSGTKKGVLPIKSSDDKLNAVEKYGGYNNIGKAYFFIVEYMDKKKKKVKFFDMPIHKAAEIESSKTTLLDYCINDLNLNSPKIIESKILINTKIKKDGFVYEISGSSGKDIGLKKAIPLKLSFDNYDYVYKLEKYLSKLKEHEKFNSGEKQEELEEFSKTLERRNSITKEKNYLLFDELVDKLNNSIFKNMATVSSLLDAFNNCSDTFKELSIIEQSKNLEQVMLLFSCKAGGCDLSKFGKSKSSGVATMTKNISRDFTIINQSVTGIYGTERRIKIDGI
ncbi:MAG: type II CRISPR RNA-guided endonuclease Cas9 [Sphaerochaeta sp.]